MPKSFWSTASWSVTSSITAAGPTYPPDEVRVRVRLSSSETARFSAGAALTVVGGGHRHHPAARRLHVVVQRHRAGGVGVHLDQRAGRRRRAGRWRRSAPGSGPSPVAPSSSSMTYGTAYGWSRTFTRTRPFSIVAVGSSTSTIVSVAGSESMSVSLASASTTVEVSPGLGLGDVVAGDRGVDVALDRADQDRRARRVEQPVADAVDQLVQPRGVGGHLGGDRVVVVDCPLASGWPRR